MNIIISNNSDEPIYKQISDQIKEKIINNKLKEGEKLPSIRELAKDLRLSVTTTKRVYDDLELEGYVETFRGKGTFVGKQNKELIREEKLKEIEDHLIKIIEIKNLLSLDDEELIDIYNLLKEGM